MVLNDIARALCQLDQRSPNQRAIMLFGFQIAVLSPSLPQLESDARLLAALKILESLEHDVAPDAGLQRRLEVSGYVDVLDLAMREGGAKKLRSSWTTKRLWEDTDVRLDQARDVACMVEFSHRFAKFGQPKGSQKGGPTMARYFVRTCTGQSDGTLKSRWREYGDRAVLQYLMILRHKELKPKKLSGKKFVDRLLQQAEDVQQMRSFFAGYMDLAAILRPRGYKFEDISLAGLSTYRPSYTLQPFSETELRAINNYKS
jgi:hypothetical protein